MLPSVLNANICSLLSNVDRLIDNTVYMLYMYAVHVQVHVPCECTCTCMYILSSYMYIRIYMHVHVRRYTCMSMYNVHVYTCPCTMYMYIYMYMFGVYTCMTPFHVNRYAVSVVWKLDTDYQVKDVWYGRTIIRSKYTLSYEVAQRLFDGAAASDIRDHIPELMTSDLTDEAVKTR